MRPRRSRGIAILRATALAVVALALTLSAGIPSVSAGPSLRARAGPGPPDPPGCRACDPTFVDGRPAAVGQGWSNVTAEQLGVVPPASAGAALALDVATGAMVWFGGCAPPGCTGNQTWTFSNGTWSNVTGSIAGVAPPARTDAMFASPGSAMETQPVLFGGVGAGGPLRNDTWAFQGTGWSPLAVGCGPTCPPPLAGAGFAWDGPGRNVSVLFGGCLSAECTERSNETWGLACLVSCTWANLSAGPAPSARSNVAMGFDPTLGAMLLFGGEAACGASACASDDLWSLAGAGWSNATADPTGAVPPPRVAGSLVWDAEAGGMLLSGGTAAAGGTPLNSSYLLVCSGANLTTCAWSGPLSGTGPALPGAAMASSLGAFDPMSVGGTEPGGSPTNATWVFGVVPSLNVAVAPAPPVVGEPVYLNATAVGSPRPTFVFLWGDGDVNRSGSGDGVHRYVRAGPENASVLLLEPNGSANLHRIALDVEGTPTGTIGARWDPVDAGVPDELVFTPDLGSGIPPFTVNWTYPGGGATDTLAADPSFAVPGNVTVDVAVTDSTGLVGSVSRTLQVDPAPLVRLTPEFTVDGMAAADALTPTAFLANVTGGTPPFGVSWSFGDGATGAGSSAAHAYASGPANRTAVATVEDAGGSWTNTSLAIRVFPELAVTGLDVSPAAVAPGSTVRLGASWEGGDGTSTVEWTFGDGGHATGGPSVLHAYRSAGSYRATVWINDTAGALASRTVVVNVVVPAATGELLEVGAEVAVGGAAVALAAGAILVLRRRRRGAAPPRTGPDAD